MSRDDQKRRDPRIATPTLNLQVATAEKFRRRYIRDLSQGGVYVRTHDVHPVGTEIRLELLPPGWEQPIRVRGEVVRVARIEEDGESTAVGMGVQFKDVGPQNRELLAELLSEYESSAPKFDEDEAFPDDPDELRKELRALRTRLRESREMLTTLHDEIEGLEEDDTSNRAIIERIVRDNQQLSTDAAAALTELEEKLRDKHAADLRTILGGYEKRQRKAEARSKKRIEELEATQTELEGQLAQTRAHAIQVETDFRELHGDLQRVIEEAHKSSAIEREAAVAEERARADELQKRLEHSEARAQRIKKKEQELRRLVAVFSGGNVSSEEEVGDD